MGLGSQRTLKKGDEEWMGFKVSYFSFDSLFVGSLRPRCATPGTTTFSFTCIGSSLFTLL